MYTPQVNRQELENGRKEVRRARLAMQYARTRKARIAAEESLNWWQGKVAMLEVKIAKGL